MQRRVIDERICRLKIKDRFLNFSRINVHSPQGNTDDKCAFYAQLARECDRCSSHGVKAVLGDLNTQVSQ